MDIKELLEEYNKYLNDVEVKEDGEVVLTETENQTEYKLNVNVLVEDPYTEKAVTRKIERAINVIDEDGKFMVTHIEVTDSNVISLDEGYIKKVTKDEWDKTHDDYKMIRNGKKYMMYIDPECHKTVLGPVEIIDESLNEAMPVGACLEILRDKAGEVRGMLDKILERAQYRLVDNVSYVGPEAEKVAYQAYNKLNEILKQVQEMYNIFG